MHLNLTSADWDIFIHIPPLQIFPNHSGNLYGYKWCDTGLCQQIIDRKPSYSSHRTLTVISRPPLKEIKHIPTPFTKIGNELLK